MGFDQSDHSLGVHEHEGEHPLADHSGGESGHLGDDDVFADWAVEDLVGAGRGEGDPLEGAGLAGEVAAEEGEPDLVAVLDFGAFFDRCSDVDLRMVRFSHVAGQVVGDVVDFDARVDRADHVECGVGDR